MINIYYLNGCPHSLKALETLHKYNIEHTKIESSDDKIKIIRKEYYPTFPQIYWHDNLIGGNDNLTSIIKSLRSNIIPNNHNNWEAREWYSCLLNITYKL